MYKLKINRQFWKKKSLAIKIRVSSIKTFNLVFLINISTTGDFSFLCLQFNEIRFPIDQTTLNLFYKGHLYKGQTGD